MKYDVYERKVLRFAAFLRAVAAHARAIAAVGAALLLAVAGLLAAKGTVIGGRSCPREVLYGEPLGYRARVFLGRASYEYRERDGGTWSGTAPSRVGAYEVRAVGRPLLGPRRRGGPRAYAIVPRPVTVQSLTETRVYDGTPLRNAGYAVLSERGFAEGEEMVVRGSAERTDVGSVPNAFTDYAVCAAGDPEQDRTENYDLTVLPGVLTVRKRPVAVVAASGEKTYDGRPLRNAGYTVAPGPGFAEGQTLLVRGSAELTDAGSVPNVLEGCAVVGIDRPDRDYTANYDLRILPGVLTVRKRPVAVAASSGDKTYDGTPLRNAGYTVAPGLGFAEGQTLLVRGSAELTDAGSIPNVLEGCAVVGIGQPDRDYTANYDLRIEPGVLTVWKRPVSVMTASGSKMYDGTPLRNAGYTVAPGPGFAEGQTLLVRGSAELTDAGSIPNVPEDCAVVGIGQPDRDYTANYDLRIVPGSLTVEKRPVAVVTASRSKTYDGRPLRDAGYTVAQGLGFAEGQTLVVRRSAELTDVGSVPNVFADCAVVGIRRPDRDYTANYDLRIVPGALRVKGRPIIVTSVSGSKIYDGAPLTAPAVRVADDSPYPLAEGDRLTAAVDGSQTAIGRSENGYRVGSVQVLDAQGRSVTGNYVVTEYRRGVLEVMPRAAAEVVLYQLRKHYDGTPLSYGEEDYEVRVADGYTLAALEVRVGLTDVGQLSLAELNANRDRYLSYRLLYRGRDVTAQSNVVFTAPVGAADDAPIRVERREIELTAASETRVFDGETLVNPTVYLSKGALAEGDVLEASAAGSLSYVGETENAVDEGAVRVWRGRGARRRDVARNYLIRTVPGVLRLVEGTDPAAD